MGDERPAARQTGAPIGCGLQHRIRSRLGPGGTSDLPRRKRPCTGRGQPHTIIFYHVNGRAGGARRSEFGDSRLPPYATSNPIRRTPVPPTPSLSIRPPRASPRKRSGSDFGSGPRASRGGVPRRLSRPSTDAVNLRLVNAARAVHENPLVSDLLQ
jgi:hypothetical protein